MKILIIEATGMVGHVVALYLQEKGHQISSYEGSLHDEKMLAETLEKGQYDAVVNCAAIINQFADEDPAEAVYINSYLPHLLEKLTKNSHTIVVHRSTDCVFSGKKGKYTVADKPDAESFYARTKAIGELENPKDITIRTSLIGPEKRAEGISLLNWFLQQEGEVKGFANAIWTGLTTLEFAKQIEEKKKKKAHGTFHLVPQKAISKHDLLHLFNQYFPKGRNIIRIENQLVDKSLQQDLGGNELHIADYQTQIAEMAAWIKEHQELYPKYYRI